MFQPSSSPKAGCDCPLAGGDFDVGGVSTLIQPEGRMRRSGLGGEACGFKFQPSSSPKAGCDVVKSSFVEIAGEFQPSSSPKAGCDLTAMTISANASNVSTLIQPEGRMRQQEAPQYWHWELLFQPSSSPKAGCDQQPAWGIKAVFHVSTLIQPEGRMRHQRSQARLDLAGTASMRETPYLEYLADPRAGASQGSSLD